MSFSVVVNKEILYYTNFISGCSVDIIVWLTKQACILTLSMSSQIICI